MLNQKHLAIDLKQIFRDPIMTIMFFAPFLLIVIFKVFQLFLIPYIHTKSGFDLSLYHHYILSFILLSNSSMLGIVTGFMMLDERDGNIIELMEVTPLGKSGYLINRLTLASIASAFYAIISCIAFNNSDLPILTMFSISILSAIYSAIIGLLIFLGAEDKVKGLSFSKALNALMIFAFTDLFSIQWLIVVSYIFPPYWISKILGSPFSIANIGIALTVHIAWLIFLIYKYAKK